MKEAYFIGRKPKISYELKIINVEKYINREKSGSELASDLGMAYETFRECGRKYNDNGS